MKTRRDWLGIALVVVLCALSLYIIGWIPTYPPIKLKEGFLASAGSGVMAPPSKIKCKKTGLNATAAPSLVQSGGQTWLCEDSTNANKLIAGDLTLKMAYISRNDLVCVSQDASGTIYTCMDQSMDPADESPANQYTNYTTACNNFYAKYLDISSALTTLITMRDTITGNTVSLQSSHKLLDTMFTNYKCAATPASYSEGQKRVCNAISQSRTAMLNDVNLSSALETILMKNITPALESRAGLIRTLNEYHCDFVLPKV